MGLPLHLPGGDLWNLKQDAGAVAEVLVALHTLVAPPAEVGTAVAACHLVAAL